MLPTAPAPHGCPMLGRLDSASLAVLEERLRAIHESTHESLARIEALLAAQNGRLRAVEDGQSEARGGARVRERVSNLVSAIIGGLVVAAGRQLIGGS